MPTSPKPAPRSTHGASSELRSERRCIMNPAAVPGVGPCSPLVSMGTGATHGIVARGDDRAGPLPGAAGAHDTEPDAAQTRHCPGRPCYTASGAAAEATDGCRQSRRSSSPRSCSAFSCSFSCRSGGGPARRAAARPVRPHSAGRCTDRRCAAIPALHRLPQLTPATPRRCAHCLMRRQSVTHHRERSTIVVQSSAYGQTVPAGGTVQCRPHDVVPRSSTASLRPRSYRYSVSGRGPWRGP